MFSMAYKVILHKGFSEGVSYLIFGINREYFDLALSNMFPEMMIAYVNMLGTWAESWELG